MRLCFPHMLLFALLLRPPKSPRVPPNQFFTIFLPSQERRSDPICPSSKLFHNKHILSLTYPHRYVSFWYLFPFIIMNKSPCPFWTSWCHATTKMFKLLAWNANPFAEEQVFLELLISTPRWFLFRTRPDDIIKLITGRRAKNWDINILTFQLLPQLQQDRDICSQVLRLTCSWKSKWVGEPD